jgi:hypothetical protein
MPAGRSVRLDFLAHDQVTKQEVEKKLGSANANFEHGSVLTYRLAAYKTQYYVQPNSDGGWEGVDYDLVLVFDDNGVMRRHRLVAVRQK